MSRQSIAKTTLSPPAGKTLTLLGRRLKLARRRRRISVRDMASRLQISPDTLVRLERGDAGVAVGIVVAAADVLGLLGEISSLFVPENDAIGNAADRSHLPIRVRPAKEPSDPLAKEFEE